MGIEKISFEGNPNIGLYAYPTDSYCLVGQDVPLKDRKVIEKALSVPVHPLTIGGTSLIGVFLAGNDKTLLLPTITFDHELAALEKLGIPFTIIETKLTALGNNLLITKDACIASDEYPAEVKKRIRQALGIKVVPGTIGEVGTVGSLSSVTDKGIFVGKTIDRDEEAKLRKHFTLPIEKGTVNQGNPYIHSAIIANKNGCLIGTATNGVEVNDALQALGFL